MEFYAKKIINKNNLIDNFEFLKKVSNKKIICVVKSNAYGHGALNVINCLKDKCDFFATENLEEALQIRNCNKSVKILILGKCSNLKLAVENNIDITIDDIDELSKLAQIETNRINIHIKINSGMNRLGVKTQQEFKTMLKIIEKNKQIKFEGLSTHFSCLQDELLTLSQIKQFKKFVKLSKKFNPIVHVGGSCFVYYQNSTFVDYIRCGIMLYGYGDKRLKPVMQILAPIVKVLQVNKGERVGYDCNFVAKENTKIGIIPLGYADGIKKSMENKFSVKIKNCYASQLGKICMDMFMVKLDANIKQGEECVVFNDANEWAKLQNTSEYEVLTNLIALRANSFVI